jgi:hypothetical protein
MKSILVFDTSVLCVWLKVPGKSRCATFRNNPSGLTHSQISELVQREEQRGTTFVLPLAAIIETGNHISQASKLRYEIASCFADLIRKSAQADTPWAAFTDQATLWNVRRLVELSETFPDFAASRFSIGDVTIKAVAEYYAQAGWSVRILTCDSGLQAYEPAEPPPTPRRRS